MVSPGWIAALYAGLPTEAHGVASWTSTHTSSQTERWIMDFVHDALADGRPFQILTMVDHWSRCSQVLAAGLRMSGEAVSQALDRVQDEGQSPRSITVDHGTEFQSRALEDWASRRGCPARLHSSRQARGVWMAITTARTAHSGTGPRRSSLINVRPSLDRQRSTLLWLRTLRTGPRS